MHTSIYYAVLWILILTFCLSLCLSTDELIFWASVDEGGLARVKMASLSGTGQVTLLTEAEASYSGITLYKDCLYISDKKRRSVFYIVSAMSDTLDPTLYVCIYVGYRTPLTYVA